MRRFFHAVVVGLGAVVLGGWTITTASGQPALPAIPPNPGPPRVGPMSDHSLVKGRLQGEAQQRRFQEFVTKTDASIKQHRELGDIYREYLEDLGVTRMVDWLERRNPFCHDVAHDLGAVVAERTSDLGLGMAVCGDSCSYGCIHGVFKTVFKNKMGTGHHAHGRAEPPTRPPQQIERLAGEINQACREDSTIVKDFFRGNCAHGVGHAFGALAYPIVTTATEYCTIFPDVEMRYYCETGVFMELTDRIKTDLYSRTTTREDQVKAGIEFCVKNSETPSSCMRFIVKRARNLEDIAAIASSCVALKGKHRRGCFNALGFLGRAYAVFNPQDIGLVCRWGDPTDQSLCISGMAFMKKEHLAKDGMSTACQYLERPDLRSLCADQSGRSYYRLDNKVLNAMFID